MKVNKGKGIIKALIILIIIIVAILFGLYYVKSQYQNAKSKTIETNMSMVELKASEYINKQKAEGKEEITYIGKKISEMSEDSIIDEFKLKNIITEEEYEKYYVLNNEDLLVLEANFGNEESSYYLINYETGDVIITSGYEQDNKILYKLMYTEEENLNLEDNEN